VGYAGGEFRKELLLPLEAVMIILCESSRGDAEGVPARVISADEDLTIARHTRRIVNPTATGNEWSPRIENLRDAGDGE
jgi:hypothetical protein